MLGYDDFSWRKDRLYQGAKDTGFSICLFMYDKDQMFYKVEWPDGVKSKDFYNIDHAKQNAIEECLKQYRISHAEAPLVSLN